MTKKLMSAILCGALVFMLLTACSGEKPVETAPATEPAHVHTAAGEWQWNAKEHYQVCQCGEIFDQAPHTVDGILCSGCGVELWDTGDGYVDAYGYNQYGDMTRQVSFDPDGNILTEMTYEYEYDTDGNKIKDQFYVDGRLLGETEYAEGEDGSYIPARYVYYDEDGGLVENFYDQFGNLTAAIGYDADGNVLFESYSEYQLDDDGNYYEAKLTETNGDGEKSIYEYNRYHDIISRVEYDLGGSLLSEESWEYSYNDAGDPMWEKQYRNGVLVYEIVAYATYETEDYYTRFLETIVEYYEDGTKLVTQNGLTGDTASETYYNADGSIATVVSYVYEMDEHGDWTSVKIYWDDVLETEIVYSTDADGWKYRSMDIEYRADGTKTVYEYDESGEEIKVTTYDASGNEL